MMKTHHSTLRMPLQVPMYQLRRLDTTHSYSIHSCSCRCLMRLTQGNLVHTNTMCSRASSIMHSLLALLSLPLLCKSHLFNMVVNQSDHAHLPTLNTPFVSQLVCCHSYKLYWLRHSYQSTGSTDST